MFNFQRESSHFSLLIFFPLERVVLFSSSNHSLSLFLSPQMKTIFFKTTHTHNLLERKSSSSVEHTGLRAGEVGDSGGKKEGKKVYTVAVVSIPIIPFPLIH